MIIIFLLLLACVPPVMVWRRLFLVFCSKVHTHAHTHFTHSQEGKTFIMCLSLFFVFFFYVQLWERTILNIVLWRTEAKTTARKVEVGLWHETVWGEWRPTREARSERWREGIAESEEVYVCGYEGSVRNDKLVWTSLCSYKYLLGLNLGWAAPPLPVPYRSLNWSTLSYTNSHAHPFVPLAWAGDIYMWADETLGLPKRNSISHCDVFLSHGTGMECSLIVDPSTILAWREEEHRGLGLILTLITLMINVSEAAKLEPCQPLTADLSLYISLGHAA